MDIALLIAAVALPPILFWMIGSRLRWPRAGVAALAVVVGWGMNLAWAASSAASAENLPIAARFGWACPTVLVLLTWAIQRYRARRAH